MSPISIRNLSQPGAFSNRENGLKRVMHLCMKAFDGTEASPGRLYARRYCPGRVVLVEWRDEVAARLKADFVARGIETEHLRWPKQLSQMPICREGSMIVINGDQPFQNGWLLPCKLRVACPDSRIWLYRAQSTAEDQMGIGLCGLDQLIAYGGDIWRLSKTIGDRLTRLKRTAGMWSGRNAEACCRPAG